MELSIGLRIVPQQGLVFFGLDEVNEKLDRGVRILAIKEGEAIMKKTGETDEAVRLSFSGFSLNVVFEDSGATPDS